METTGLFNKDNTDLKFSQLCSITKDRIESFLPGLWEDLFKVANSNNKPAVKTKEPTMIDVQAELNIKPIESTGSLPNINKELEELSVTSQNISPSAVESNHHESQFNAAPGSPVKVIFIRLIRQQSFKLINFCFVFISQVSQVLLKFKMFRIP